MARKAEKTFPKIDNQDLREVEARIEALRNDFYRWSTETKTDLDRLDTMRGHRK